jgi:cytochrome c nitrite reductase small subunit
MRPRPQCGSISLHMSPAPEPRAVSRLERVLRRSAVGLAALSAAVGLAVGVGGYTFHFAKGTSYFGNDPATCANCHIMEDHYSGWLKSSHRLVATCNDCHTPANFVGKYISKADNGFWHSYAFTTGDYPDPIRIKARNLVIAENACRKCHTAVTHAIDLSPPGEPFSCIRCHSQVGHP